MFSIEPFPSFFSFTDPSKYLFKFPPFTILFKLMFKSTSLQRSLKCRFCCNLFTTLHLHSLLHLYKYTFTMAIVAATFQLMEKYIRFSIQSSFCKCHFQRAHITFYITDIKVHLTDTVTTSLSPDQSIWDL